MFHVINKNPESPFNFQASIVWFKNFKHRFSLHNVKFSHKITSADLDSMKKFEEEFCKIF